MAVSPAGSSPAVDLSRRDARRTSGAIRLETAGIVILSFLFFYVHRSRHYAGDGALLDRLIEGGKWLVQNELLSQAFLQLLYRLASPWGRTPLEIMNWASCLGGALSVWILLRFARRFYQLPFWYPLLLFLSSGFLVYACGHTEYYPLVLPALSALAIFTFLGNWNAFLWPVIIVSKPHLVTLPVGLAMFTTENNPEWERIMTAASLGTVPVLIVFILFQRQIIEGVNLSGMKA